MKYKKPVGWRGESHRHYLAAKGVATKHKYRANKYYYDPTFAVGDLSAIGADAIGTTGAATVSYIPAIVPLALLYGGAVYVSNRKEKRKKQGKGFFAAKDAEFTEEQLNAFEDMVGEAKAAGKQSFRFRGDTWEIPVAEGVVKRLRAKFELHGGETQRIGVEPGEVPLQSDQLRQLEKQGKTTLIDVNGKDITLTEKPEKKGDVQFTPAMRKKIESGGRFEHGGKVFSRGIM